MMAVHTVRIWDWPVRMTHWSFAALIPAMWFTAEYSHWWWHTRLGHVLLGLLIFRVIWGVIGTDTARFASFVKGPARVIEYLRGEHDYKIGHSPLGALSVIALLSVMAAQVGMGLFAGDPYDGATGPLNPLVGVMTADWLTETHKWFVYVVLGMVGLHLAAIGFYVGWKRQKLIRPMVSGKDEMGQGADENSRASWGRVMIALAVAIGVSVWAWNGAPPLS